MTPLRQFKGVPGEIIRKAEGKQFVRIIITCNVAVDVLTISYSHGIATSIS